MFKPTDRQISLLTPSSLAPTAVATRLKETWADGFQRYVLPVLLDLEEEFASLFGKTGRPNWSVARIVGLAILQQLNDADDQAVLDSLSFDMRYQHALGLSGEEAYLSRRSFVSWRSRLALNDPEGLLMRKVFDSLRDEAIEDLGISLGKQRLDSTHIVSNIHTSARADLFGKTLRHFIRGLKNRWPHLLDRLAPELREWALVDEDGWFAKGGADHRVLLQQRAEWLHAVIEAFRDDDDVSADERYQLVERVFREHCVLKPAPTAEESGSTGCARADIGPVEVAETVVTDESAEAPGDRACDQGTTPRGPTEPEASVETPNAVPATTSTSDVLPQDTAPESFPACAPDAPVSNDNATGSEATTEATAADPVTVCVLPKPTVAGSGLQSPFDPDAGFGHKGRGYHVQVTETCGNSGPEIITDYGVVPANVTDNTQVGPVLDRLGETRVPHTLFADSGYATTGNILNSRERSVELCAPVPHGKLPEDHIGRDRFEFDEATGHVKHCPEGHAPIRHGLRSTTNCAEPTLHAYFDGETCRSCPLQKQCAVRGPNNGKKGSFHLELLPNLRERDQALARQRDPEWWGSYQIRAGVEATASELKRAHGLGRLRVRRKPRVTIMVALKATACNVKRWLRAKCAASARPDGGPQAAVADLWRSCVAWAAMVLLMIKCRHMRLPRALC